MAHGFREGLSLERIEVDVGYSPENCRWATRQEQAENLRKTVLITAFGETKTMRAWSYTTGIWWTTLRYRYQRGLRAEALLAPVTRQKTVHHQGVLRPEDYQPSGFHDRTIPLGTRARALPAAPCLT